MGVQVQNSIILGVVVAIGFGIFYMSQNSDFFQSATLSPEEVALQTTTIEQTILADLNSLQSIELDDEVFRMDEYALLVDDTVVIVTQPTGNPYPFVPDRVDEEGEGVEEGSL
jgi:hypothetical protein